MKKVCIGMLLCSLFFMQTVLAKWDAPEDIVAKSYIVMDNNSNHVLMEKDAQKRINPASLAKIMTGIIVVENTRNYDRMITLTKSDLAFIKEVNASHIGTMEVGDQLSIKDALYGLMLASAGDCAMMLSHSVAGTTSEFVELMNQKAEQLGLSNTHFTNAVGVQQEGQYSTAEDLAKLLQYAMKNEQLSSIMATTSYTLHPTLTDSIEIQHSAKISFQNNKIPYDDIIAAKTGYETEDGHCLAIMAQQGDKEILSVVIGSGMDKKIDESPSDTRKLIDTVFANTSFVRLDASQLEQQGIELPTDANIQMPISFLVDQGLHPEDFQYAFENNQVGVQVGTLKVTIAKDISFDVPVYANEIKNAKENYVLYITMLIVVVGYCIIQHKRHQVILKGEKGYGKSK